MKQQFADWTFTFKSLYSALMLWDSFEIKSTKCYVEDEPRDVQL